MSARTCPRLACARLCPGPGGPGSGLGVLAWLGVLLGAVLLAGCSAQQDRQQPQAQQAVSATSVASKASKAVTARLALEALLNPWATASDAALDKAGQSWCTLVAGGQTVAGVARIFADNPPAPSEGLPTLTYDQAMAFGTTMVSVYCPERVGR